MPYQRLAEHILARWRQAERELVDAADDDVADDLRAEAAQLREEYQRLVAAIREGHPGTSSEAEALKAAVFSVRETMARGERPRLHATAEGNEPTIEVRVIELPGIHTVAHHRRMVQSVAAGLAATVVDVDPDAIDVYIVEDQRV